MKEVHRVDPSQDGHGEVGEEAQAVLVLEVEVAGDQGKPHLPREEEAVELCGDGVENPEALEPQEVVEGATLA